MAAYEDFFEYVGPAVPGAAEPLVLRAIRDACIDFAVETQLFTKTLEPIPSAAGIADYEIETPENTVVTQVTQAWFNRVPITVSLGSGTDQNALMAEYGVTPKLGTPCRVIYTSGNTFVLDPVPEVSGLDVVLAVALKPTRASAEVWDQLYEDHAEVIAAGALSKLMAIKGQTFFDPNEALLHDKLFKNGQNRARLRALAGGIGNRALRVSYRRIG